MRRIRKVGQDEIIHLPEPDEEISLRKDVICVGGRLIPRARLFDIVQFEFDIILPLGESHPYLMIKG
jgi:hypothetical protein